MGEENFVKKSLVKALDEAISLPEVRGADLCVDTTGGRFHVRWDEGGSATALGQLAFFSSGWKLWDCSAAGLRCVHWDTPAPMHPSLRTC